jgi:hypothetical protein
MTNLDTIKNEIKKFSSNKTSLTPSEHTQIIQKVWSGRITENDRRPLGDPSPMYFCTLGELGAAFDSLYKKTWIKDTRFASDGGRWAYIKK